MSKKISKWVYLKNENLWDKSKSFIKQKYVSFWDDFQHIYLYIFEKLKYVSSLEIEDRMARYDDLKILLKHWNRKLYLSKIIDVDKSISLSEMIDTIDKDKENAIMCCMMLENLTPKRYLKFKKYV